MDAGGARLLGDPHDRVLDVAGRGHHQVGELVDDGQDVRIRLVDAFAAERGGDVSRPDLRVEVVDVAHPRGLHVLVALLHLLDEPGECGGGLLRLRDDRRDEVRDPLVRGELDHLRVDQDHPHLLRRRAAEQRHEHRVDEARLARTGRAGDQQVRHLRQVGADEIALDVLAEPDHQRMLVLPGRRRVQHVGQANHLTVGVGDLDTDRGLAGDRREQAHVVGCRGVGDVALQRGDLLDLHARTEFDLVSRDGRPAGVSGDRGVDLELLQHAGHPVDHVVVGAAAHLRRIALEKQIGRRQAVVPVRGGIGRDERLVVRHPLVRHLVVEIGFVPGLGFGCGARRGSRGGPPGGGGTGTGARRDHLGDLLVGIREVLGDGLLKRGDVGDVGGLAPRRPSRGPRRRRIRRVVVVRVRRVRPTPGPRLERAGVPGIRFGGVGLGIGFVEIRIVVVLGVGIPLVVVPGRVVASSDTQPEVTGGGVDDLADGSAAEDEYAECHAQQQDRHRDPRGDTRGQRRAHREADEPGRAGSSGEVDRRTGDEVHQTEQRKDHQEPTRQVAAASLRGGRPSHQDDCQREETDRHEHRRRPDDRADEGLDEGAHRTRRTEPDTGADEQAEGEETECCPVPPMAVTAGPGSTVAVGPVVELLEVRVGVVDVVELSDDFGARSAADARARPGGVADAPREQRPSGTDALAHRGRPGRGDGTTMQVHRLRWCSGPGTLPRCPGLRPRRGTGARLTTRTTALRTAALRTVTRRAASGGRTPSSRTRPPRTTACGSTARGTSSAARGGRACTRACLRSHTDRLVGSGHISHTGNTDNECVSKL